MLVRHKPTPASDDVEHAVKILDETIAKLTRHSPIATSKTNSAMAGEDAALDLFVDDLWYVLDERLEHWKVFERPAAERLAEAQNPEGFDYSAAIEKARKAEALLTELGF